MAWVTTLYPGEEIIIDGKTVVRVDSERATKIRIDSIGAPPRPLVIKHRIGAEMPFPVRK